MPTYEGGCHCGAVRFAVTTAQTEALDCNCTICRKKGFLHLLVPAHEFQILRGQEALVSYRFNTGIAHHRFCGTCGIHPFYTPRSHPDGVDVNVRCLDGDQLDAFTVKPFDGQNWEDNVERIR
jgi:hypothetical protein